MKLLGCVRQSPQCQKPPRGLTLIELMVVVAVLAILATLVYPAYENLIRSVRRSDARTAAHAVALAQERFFTVNGRYTDDDEELFPEGSPYRGNNSEKGYYAWAVQASTTTFLVTVDAVSGKSQDSDEEKAVCDELTINSAGVESGKPSSSAGGKCWPHDY